VTTTEPVRRRVPFAGHQLAEYALAAALFGVGVHSTGRPALTLMVGGGLLAVLAAVSTGSLAVASLVSRRAHVVIDLVLAALFALSPLAWIHDLQVIPIVLLEAVAVLLVRMSFTTELVPRPRPARPARRTRLGSTPGPLDQAVGLVEPVARDAMRRIGRAAGVARRAARAARKS